MIHSMVIHALMMSWYPRRRPSNPTIDVMMDLDPWRSSCVVEVVEEAHEVPWHDKEAFGTPNGPNDPFCGHFYDVA